ncbi:cytochrome P450 [Streptomyces sp. NPDC048254]|uniref:cytochrome P450 n=1 Tax=Streptomyces sp. NPDC048254 TaxID=3365525 RepID=UPI00372419D8
MGESTLSPIASTLDPAEAMAALGTPAGRANPYPIYEALRAHGPVLNLGPLAVLTGYEECARALREPAFVSTDPTMRDRLVPGWREQPAWRSICTTMLFHNDPIHERLRRFSTTPFSPTAVSAMRPMLERLTEAAVDRVEKLGAGGEPVEFMDTFACRLPLAVMGELLGIPPEEQPAIQPLLRPVTEGLDPFGDPALLTSANHAVEELAAYFADLVARRRATPEQDLVSAFAKARDDGADLSEDELIATYMVLLVAGTAAPFDLVGNTMALAARHPEHADRVREDPELAAAFVEEGFRYDPAVQVLNRVVAEDIEYFGVPLPAGTAVLLLIAAGNRDPRRFDAPGRFDPSRPNVQPLTFGLGAHYCLGSALGRLEGAIALNALVRRFPNPVIHGEPTYRDQLVQRGFETFHIRVS